MDDEFQITYWGLLPTLYNTASLFLSLFLQSSDYSNGWMRAAAATIFARARRISPAALYAAERSAAIM